MNKFELILDKTVDSTINNYKNTGNKQEVFVDPVTITLIATIIREVVNLIKQCTKSPEEAHVIVTNPSSEHISKLKAIIRKKVGFIKYFIVGVKILKAVRKTGREIQGTDANVLFSKRKQS